MHGGDPRGSGSGPQGHSGFNYRSTMDVNEIFRKAFGNMVSSPAYFINLQKLRAVVE